MVDDPLSLPATPPAKRRRLLAVEVTPIKYSDLLTAFGARPSPSSVSRVNRSQALRKATRVSYAESEGSMSSKSSPQPSDFASSQANMSTSPQQPQDSWEDESLVDAAIPDSDGVDELQSNEVNAKPLPRGSSLGQRGQALQAADRRRLPPRSAKSRSKPLWQQRTIHRGGLQASRGIAKSRKLIASDVAAANGIPSTAAKPDTARGTLRQNIADHTKPRREAFYFANSELFLPLLPPNNFIEKLQRTKMLTEPVPYAPIMEQPVGVKATMKPYQLEGLSFLVHMYRNGVSAILGDEMGLGKTLQTLSLFQFLRENHATRGQHQPYLVVCPLSVLSSWVNEAGKWCPNLNVLRFHGSKAERDRIKLEAVGKIDRYGRVMAKGVKNPGPRGKPFDLVITSYETFVAEQSWFKRAYVWRYCVLDEGHKIKNDKSNVATALQGLTAENRLLLTGTPLQNNLHEMWALLHWLYPDVFAANTSDMFRNAFNLTLGKVSTSFMDDARKLLELVMIRRMKSSPGVNLGLPPKEEILLYVPLTPMQRFWYMRLLTKAGNALLDDLFKDSRTKEEESLQIDAQEDQKLKTLESVSDQLQSTSGSVWDESKEIMQLAIQNEVQESQSSDWKKLMNLMIQLRKACSHPYILPNAAPDPYYLGDHVRTASGKFVVLAKLVEELVIKQKKKILIFSGWTRVLDLCEDLLSLQGANSHDGPFRFLRLDGSTARARRNLGIRMFNDLKSDFRVMLISTRAGGLGINLATASDVVFLDEDWNPQITLQAEARAHRIGQTQKVTIYKLCTQGTVEEQMMGRIRKKLYLSAKITESMRNIHGETQSKKRKRGPQDSGLNNEEAPQLGASELKQLIRRGAQTLARPEVDVNEMLGWDWQTTLEKCKDKTDNVQNPETKDIQDTAAEEQEWLNTMERVETAVFEGKKHQQKQDQQATIADDLVRGDRRLGKNTTVMIDGFAINKESLNCGDWEAVPTMAGKDPRLANPVRAKKEPVPHEDQCHVCKDGGDLYLCSGCPRGYHLSCLSPEMRKKAKGKLQFYCSQHQCDDCEKKAVEAGGMIYRCCWCEHGYCEDCLDWDTVRLIGDTLPEFDMIGYGAQDNAWYVDCPSCVAAWKEDSVWKESCMQDKIDIEKEYEAFLATESADEMVDDKTRLLDLSPVNTELVKSARKLQVVPDMKLNLMDLTGDTTPDTISEAQTPIEFEQTATVTKKPRQSLFTVIKNGVLGAFG